ncbi:hypothetical protein Runsl_5805 (plasmid) [Runella slithyformis DSM 19594]|uniref:Uncharacterized protein n=1 Tax=Runella slithyformis (strain ATCC 29530 / DSM 19594 / LMG 11500 / NCIMB 11436 / LSU 4) TaxID=761193 RepID=A0A7U4E9A9_RUNSL|nr:hypothetical protein Runsl_5805 [Runella slithyformis DSM 19594]
MRKSISSFQKPCVFKIHYIFLNTDNGFNNGWS